MLLMCQDSKDNLEKRRERRTARKRGSDKSDSSPSRRVKKTWASDMRGSQNLNQQEDGVMFGEIDNRSDLHVPLLQSSDGDNRSFR